jgi:LDH2 family malate/lactate/ureidoglycolate dehydrogenase
MTAVGTTRGDAALIADHLIDCELRGIHYGGLARALSIVERLRARRPAAMRRRAGDAGAGAAGRRRSDRLRRRASRATRMAIDKARPAGSRPSPPTTPGTTGMLSYYAEMAAAAGWCR